MGVKIFDRQRLHPAEQIVPQAPHRALAYIDHDPVVGKRCDHAHSHDAGQADQVRRKSAEITGTAGEHRRDIVIYQSLRERCAHYCCDRCDQDADDHKQKRKFIIMKHISDHPVDQL